MHRIAICLLAAVAFCSAALAGERTVRYTWDPVVGATGYEFQYADWPGDNVTWVALDTEQPFAQFDVPEAYWLDYQVRVRAYVEYTDGFKVYSVNWTGPMPDRIFPGDVEPPSRAAPVINVTNNGSGTINVGLLTPFEFRSGPVTITDDDAFGNLPAP